MAPHAHTHTLSLSLSVHNTPYSTYTSIAYTLRDLVERNQRESLTVPKNVVRLRCQANRTNASGMKAEQDGGGKKAFNFTFSNVFNMHVINNLDTVSGVSEFNRLSR